MLPFTEIRISIVLVTAPVLITAGCGTTSWTDTRRTATEQLLLSTAIDEAVKGIDFAPLSGKDVYLDTAYLDMTDDQSYLVGCLLERMRSQGCAVKESPAEATYIVEARAGVIGTNRQESMIGIPATSFSTPVGSRKGETTHVPEVALASRTIQTGVAKIGCFAYHRETGQGFWQSGSVPVLVSDKKTFVAGIGSFKLYNLFERMRRAKTQLPRRTDREAAAKTR